MIDNERTVRWSVPAVLRLTPITVAYCAAWAGYLSSDALVIPVSSIAAIGFFLAVQFALGFLAGTPWLLALCVCPPIFAVAFPGAIPPDSDIVGYAGFIAYMLVWPIMPIGALISWGGVLLRPRSSRAIQRRSDG